MTRARLRPLCLALVVATLPALASASGGEGSGSHLGIPDPILKTVNLLLFFGLLFWLAARPIGQALRRRREGIAASLAEAKAKREAAARTEEEIRSKIAALEAELADFARRAKEEGEKERAELIARGEAEARRLVTQAKEEVEAQAALARRELAAFAGELATDLAAKSLAAKMDDAAKKRFLDRAIGEIGKVEASR